MFDNLRKHIGNIGHHVKHHVHKAKQHFSTIADFGQKAWDTIGGIIKKGNEAVGKFASTANNYKGIHPMIDDGINFLNQVSGYGSQAQQLYDNVNEKKDTIQQSVKEIINKNIGNNRSTM